MVARIWCGAARFAHADISRLDSTLNPITLDVDSTVLTRWGNQIEGGAKGYKGRCSGGQDAIAVCG